MVGTQPRHTQQAGETLQILLGAHVWAWAWARTGLDSTIVGGNGAGNGTVSNTEMLVFDSRLERCGEH